MDESKLNRRRFGKLSVAAFGGMMAGSVVGCGGNNGGNNGEPEDSGEALDEQVTTVAHVCRGLNDCQGQGASGNNDCAGQGDCASYAAHSCGGLNECAGQGGCGDNPGANDCKEQGHCSIPLMNEAWDMAREQFEERMAASGKEFGAAPAKL